jgi:manganese/zinc/iron transport system substrate-binding protein
MIRFLILLFTILATACSPAPSESQSQTAPSGPYKVVATTGMIGDIVQGVAGDRAQVTVLIGPGTDPHIYVPSRQDLARLTEADILFHNGLHLEGRMTDAIGRLASSRPVHAVTELLEEDALLHEQNGTTTDPHVWMDVKLWMLATRAVAEALATFDPPHADHYRSNAQKLIGEFEELDAYAHRCFGSIPPEKRMLITAHDAFQYMARAYDFEVRGIQGLSTASEAGLLDINRLVDLIVERRIPTVFPESTIADRNVRALVEGAASRNHEVSIGAYLFSDAMGKPGTYEGTYIGMMDHNITAITRALGGEAPAGGLHGKLALP